MEGYVSKLQKNMKEFLATEDQMTNAERLAFIRKEYSLFEITAKVLDGRAYFVGCTHEIN
jgi:hypothetical protein